MTRLCTFLLSAFVLAKPAAAAELLVLNKSDATLSFIEPVSGDTKTSIPTGDGPHEIELSSDGRLAFVSNYGARTPGNTLSVVDVPARKELERVQLGDLQRPHGLTFSEGHLYFTAEVARRIARLDPKTRKVDWQFETGQNVTHMVLAAPNGKTLFTSNIGSNTVEIIERSTNDRWQQTLVAVGAGPEGLDLTPNGKELWSAHSRDASVSIIDVAAKKVAATLDIKTKRSNRLKFTPDGRLALISDLSGNELVVIDTSSHAERARLPVGRTPTGILITPESKLAFVACSGDNIVAVIDLSTLKVSRTIRTGGSPDGMAWVP